MLVLVLLVIVFTFGAGRFSLDKSILAKVADDDPKAAIQRVQASMKRRRARVVEEIRLKKERAASGLSTALSSSDRLVGLDSSTKAKPETSHTSIYITVFAYALIFVFGLALLLLDVIQIPEGVPVGAVVGGGIVVFLLLGMFFLIYGSALNESS